MEIYKTNLKPWNMWLPQTLCIALLLSKGVRIHTWAPSIFVFLHYVYSYVCLSLSFTFVCMPYCLLLFPFTLLFFCLLLPLLLPFVLLLLLPFAPLLLLIYCIITSTIKNHKFSKGSTKPKCLHWLMSKGDVHFD
jgi:hypothetical protein